MSTVPIGHTDASSGQGPRSGLFSFLRRARKGEQTTAEAASAIQEPGVLPWGAEIDIANNDPLLAFLASASGAVDISGLHFESPALNALRTANVRLIVPLISQGELIGMMHLGPRLSEQEFSTDDRRLLTNLAAQAAPAVRLAQLVREQEAQARARERIDQELKVAQLIQQQFLPRQLPDLNGWQVAAHYQPARAVGGDFYDFIDLPSGDMGIVVGDVTDKGIPAALVMASTRSIIRTEAVRLESPGRLLERVNDLLCPDIPARMFVTCLYAVLEPSTGRLRYANAGHNLPYRRRGGDVTELRATGMPLGLLPGMQYEEEEATLEAGDHLLLYSDGLVEAHNDSGEMFGFPRLKQLVGRPGPLDRTIDVLLTELGRFTGVGGEQEDDITLVTIARSPAAWPAEAVHEATGRVPLTLVKFDVASEPGNEVAAMERVAEAVVPLGLPQATVDRLRTAVSEATMNAIEHGNHNRADVPVSIVVTVDHHRLVVRIADEGTSGPPVAGKPDLDLKLAGLQSARGWGLFLIEKMVDELHHLNTEDGHVIELVMHLPGKEVDDA